MTVAFEQLPQQVPPQVGRAVMASSGAFYATADATADAAASAAVRKAACITGRTLRFRDAVPSDAAFILSLRHDPIKGAHLSATPASLAEQVAWLVAYADTAGQAYFIIERLDAASGDSSDADTRVGTVRLYDARALEAGQSSFCWGSWILANGAPANAAIESAMMVYAYAVDHLGFAAAHFSVNRANERVCSFHERFGAQRASQDEVEIQYTLAAAEIASSMQRFQRFLPSGVQVEGMT